MYTYYRYLNIPLLKYKIPNNLLTVKPYLNDNLIFSKTWTGMMKII
jgi:hypothetical protein